MPPRVDKFLSSWYLMPLATEFTSLISTVPRKLLFRSADLRLVLCNNAPILVSASWRRSLEVEKNGISLTNEVLDVLYIEI